MDTPHTPLVVLPLLVEPLVVAELPLLVEPLVVARKLVPQAQGLVACGRQTS